MSMMSLHLCYITHEYPRDGFAHGGVGNFTRSLGLALVALGVRVTVIRMNKDVAQESYFEDDGIHVYLLPAPQGWFKFLTGARKVNKALARLHREHPINVVETPELGLALIRKIPGIQYVIRMHGGHHFFAKAENRPTEWNKAWLEKRSFAKADHILAVSHYVAETTRALLALGNRRITVIYNPINTAKFYKANAAHTVPYRIFFAGTLVEKKGIRQLVQSLEYLVDEFPQLQLFVAGRDANIPGTNQPYRPVLEQAVTDKIRGHINFLGSVPNQEVPKLIEQAQICCYPSHMEAMPLAWLEVMAMGKVFLGSNTGPGPEAVLEGETGYLANPFDPEHIAQQIRYIFHHYDQALQLADQARLRVLEHFDVQRLALANKAFYEGLL